MDAARAARMLLDARSSGVRIAGLPPDARPGNDGDAYAIQDAQMAVLGRVGGWKVGAKTPTAEPACAPLPATLIHPSPQRFEIDRFPLHLVEAEIGFTFARHLPPRSQPYAEHDVVAALASVHATIEVLDSRYAEFHAVDPHSALADFAANGALVVGPPRTGNVRVDQTKLRLALFCDDRLVLEQTGGNTAGDVFRLLVWLANHAAARCGGLRAGNVVTTGSCIGGYPVAPGTRVRAVFAGIPAVEASV